MASFTFEMLDKISGPARQADSSLKALEGELRGTDDALKQLVRDQNLLRLNKLGGLNIGKDQQAAAKASMAALQSERIRLSMTRSLQRDDVSAAAQVRRAAQASESLAMRAMLSSQRATERQALSEAMAASKAMFRDRARAAKASLEEVGRAAGNTGVRVKGMGLLAVDALVDIASHALHAAETLGHVAVSFAASTAQAADYGQAQARLLRSQFGAVEGQRQYEILIEYSNRFGASLQDTFQQFQTLSRAGFSQPKVIQMMQQIGDTAATMGPQAAVGITTAIQQIMDKPKLSMEELTQQMSEHGVNIAHVFEEIGRPLGKTAAQVQGMFTGGQITKIQEIDAVMRVLNKDFSQGGLAGQAMANRVGNTLGGKIDLITSRWAIFKTRVGDTEAFKPLVDFLGRVADMMDGNTESGKRFQKQLDIMFKGMFEALGTTDPVEIFRKLGDFMVSASKTAPLLIESLVAIGENLGVIVEALKWISGYNIGKGIGWLIRNTADRSTGLTAAGGREGVGSLSGDVGLGAGALAAQARQRAAGISPREVSISTGAERRAAINTSVGDINVSIGAGDWDTSGMTPHEVGHAIGSGITEKLYSDLSNAAASQGNPT